MTKEIKFDDLSETLQAAIIFIGAITLTCFIFILINQNNIESIPNLPQRYCHNETEVREYQFNESIRLIGFTSRVFYHNEEIICPKEYKIDNSYGVKYIIPNSDYIKYDNSTERMYLESKCLIQTQKEVCIIQ